MTTAAVSGRPARRRAELSPLRRLSRNVLVIGTVAAALAACGPLWLVRVGVVLAVGAAVASCLLAWREVAELRRTHAAELLAASKASGAVLREERRHNASVVDTLAERARAAGEAIVQHQAVIAELRTTLRTVRAENSTLVTKNGTLSDANGTLLADNRALTRDNAALVRDVGALQRDVQLLGDDKGRLEHAVADLDQLRTVLEQEVQRRQGLVETLQGVVAARDAQLAALHSEDTTQVRGIPRRVRVADRTDLADCSDSAEEAVVGDTDAAVAAWSGDQLAGVLDFTMTATAVALPNFEEDRKLA